MTYTHKLSTMRKCFYLSPQKEVDATVTFLLQGTAPEGNNEKIFTYMETTVDRKEIIEQAIRRSHLIPYPTVCST